MLRIVEELYRVCLQTVKRGFDSCIINFLFLNFLVWKRLGTVTMSFITISHFFELLYQFPCLYKWPSWPNFLIKLADAGCVWNCCPGKILRTFLWHSITL